MTGSLDGCWYTHIETARTTRGGVYLESGTELFVGRLDDDPTGTFTTTYKFEAKLNADGADTRGCCNVLTQDRSAPSGASTYNSNFVEIAQA